MSDESDRHANSWSTLCEIVSRFHGRHAECVTNGIYARYEIVRFIENSRARHLVGHRGAVRVRPLLKEVATLWHWTHNFRRGVEPYRRTQKPECSAPPALDST